MEKERQKKLDMFFAKDIDFETSKEAEFIHTYKSAIAIFENPKIKDIHWAEDIQDYSDEVFNCELKETDKGDIKNFNVIVPKSIFDYEHFKEWSKKHTNLFWKPENTNKIKGVHYFNDAQKGEIEDEQ